MHPGAVNAMFFDGHVVTLDRYQMDLGYGANCSRRLRYFTCVPPELDCD